MMIAIAEVIAVLCSAGVVCSNFIIGQEGGLSNEA
jgi:hypothetical protein